MNFPFKDITMDWLLEKEDPGVRYLALRDLLRLPAEDQELTAARREAHQRGPIHYVLEKMAPEGYWQKPGPGYGPKYKSTVWSLLLLAQLGGNIHEDERIKTACEYYMQQAITDTGQVSYSGKPSGTIDCLQGNMCWSLVTLGVDPSRLTHAFEWMARTVTGDGLAPVSDRKNPMRYYAYKSGPVFECGANYKMACAWGGAKVMKAFSVYPEELRSSLVNKAIQTGCDFFLNKDIAKADFPNGVMGHSSRNWWRFGFPVFYITDILQIIEALVALGHSGDKRLESALQIVFDKQDDQGRWPLEYDYAGKTWRSYGKLNEPNKWVTLRALGVIQATGASN
jgi:hypothetical protein